MVRFRRDRGDLSNQDIQSSETVIRTYLKTRIISPVSGCEQVHHWTLALHLIHVVRARQYSRKAFVSWKLECSEPLPLQSCSIQQHALYEVEYDDNVANLKGWT